MIVYVQGKISNTISIISPLIFVNQKLSNSIFLQIHEFCSWLTFSHLPDDYLLM